MYKTHNKKTRTDAFLGTFNYHNLLDRRIIAELRASLKHLHGNSKYIKLQGRLGLDNPNRAKYLDSSGRWPLWNVCIKLEDSGYVDAYVYNR